MPEKTFPPKGLLSCSTALAYQIVIYHYDSTAFSKSCAAESGARNGPAVFSGLPVSKILDFDLRRGGEVPWCPFAIRRCGLPDPGLILRSAVRHSIARVRSDLLEFLTES
jgi:hypothetical protein